DHANTEYVLISVLRNIVAARHVISPPQLPSSLPLFFFSLLLPPPPRSTLFPYNDALPISGGIVLWVIAIILGFFVYTPMLRAQIDRKSTRLNSSRLVISYAVFCLKKKTN